jgi:hypothetical protein
MLLKGSEVFSGDQFLYNAKSLSGFGKTVLSLILGFFKGTPNKPGLFMFKCFSKRFL